MTASVCKQQAHLDPSTNSLCLCPCLFCKKHRPVFLRCAKQVQPLESRDAAGERAEASEAQVAEMSKEVLMSRRPAAMDTIDATRCV